MSIYSSGSKKKKHETKEKEKNDRLVLIRKSKGLFFPSPSTRSLVIQNIDRNESEKKRTLLLLRYFFVSPQREKRLYIYRKKDQSTQLKRRTHVMTRQSSLSETGKCLCVIDAVVYRSGSAIEFKSVTSRASELSVLNDDECKRILSVVERDFKLRQKEYQRIEWERRQSSFDLHVVVCVRRQVKKLIRVEQERVEYLAASKEFNQERCIRCFKPFRMIFNPREQCSECKLFICHDCSTYSKENKTWACKTCLKLK